MFRPILTTLVLAACSVLLALCCTAGSPADATIGDAEPVPQVAVPEDAQAALAWATNDLAGKLSVEPEEIALVEVTRVEWRNSSLGCPQPGRMYLQVITPGYRMILAHSGTEYAYHAAQGADSAMLCEQPPAKSNSPAPTM